MSAPRSTRRARVIGAAIVLSISASLAHAEPPRHDALKMRNAPRTSATMTTLSQSTDVKAEPAPVATAPAPAVGPANVDKASKEAADVLELCYSLARRSDRSLSAPVTVQATVRADGSVLLRTQDQNLGNGFFARCVERKLTPLTKVSRLPEADASTRAITVGAAPLASRR